jgi:hypothetical protein
MLPRTEMYIRIQVVDGINMEEMVAGHQRLQPNRLQQVRQHQERRQALLRQKSPTPHRTAVVAMPAPVNGVGAVIVGEVVVLEGSAAVAETALVAVAADLAGLEEADEVAEGLEEDDDGWRLFR